MLIITTDHQIQKILAGFCLLMPDGSYSVAPLPDAQLRNLCTELNKPKYAGNWSISFADQPVIGLRYTDLLENLDDTTGQAFLLAPGYIGADSEDLLYWLEEVYGQPVTMANYGRVAQLFRFWFASAHPDEYHDPPDVRPGLATVALQDTPDKRNARTRRRGEQIAAMLAAKGWAGQSEMLTAMLNGRVDVPANPDSGDSYAAL